MTTPFRLGLWGKPPRARGLGLLFLAVLFSPALTRGGELEEALKLFRSGKYADCLRSSAEALSRAPAEGWATLKIRSELALGEHAAALATFDAALARHAASLELRWLGAEVQRANGQPARALELIQSIVSRARAAPWEHRDPASRVALGRALVRLGADARQVLESVYDPLKKEHPDFAPAYLASGDLALEKSDHGLAAEEFAKVVNLAPADPDTLCRLALAQASGDSPAAAKTLESALAINPAHAESLLAVADRLIDAESYGEAGAHLDRVLAVNARHPRAWAYRAVLAHLEGDAGREAAAREQALASWPANPDVDHLIGRKLSQKYRFAEGEACERRALDFDPGHLPAQLQLAQDLLRLGQEEEGWRLAAAVHAADGYNVVAYNLSTLHDRLAGFRTLEADGFIVRMSPLEAEVYGSRVLALLGRARRALGPKYGVEIDRPVLVEIFPEQKDFAIRTFGLPGGAGFLGVCFGNVITATSPAARPDSPASWEAVLWHEFCHAITLRKTRNKMPRWLSEGISVYEERMASPAWGEAMNPRYREMTLGDELTPVGKLSAAFLSPPSPVHLQFAYYQSSLVVEYLVKRHGFEALGSILDDLGAGTAINEALARRAGPLADLDREFVSFARARAEGLAPRADWRQPDLPPGADSAALASWNAEHPRSFWGLQRQAQQLVSERKWEEAKRPLREMLELYPAYTGPDNAHLLLAAVHRELGEADAERAALEQLAALDAAAAGVTLRLLEIAAAAADWKAVALHADRLLAVNPLLRTVHRERARAAEELGDSARAIESHRAHLALEPVDRAEVHYRLARLLDAGGDRRAARRQALQAVEEAPRFRAAQRLLLAIVRASPPEENAPPPPAGKAREF